MKKPLFKKFLSVFLSAALVLTMVPFGFTAKAEDMVATLTPYGGGTPVPYPTVSEALADANTNDTVTLSQDTTETLNVNLVVKTVVLDGNSHTITGTGRGDALDITGGGTLILKNINLIGGTASTLSGGNGIYADSSFTGTVAACGTVTVTGGAGGDSYDGGQGVYNAGSGTVSIGTATGGAGRSGGNGVVNCGSGTVNIGTATGGAGGVNGYGGQGIHNYGTANVCTATGFQGVQNHGGTANVGTATGNGSYDVYCDNGTVNVGTVTNNHTDGGGTKNVGSDKIKTIPITVNGSGVGNVLSTLTIAASGDTSVGTLPAVYDPTTLKEYKWYYDRDQTQPVTGTTINSSETGLYAGLSGFSIGASGLTVDTLTVPDVMGNLGAQTGTAVTVTNTGTAPTGDLSVTLGGTNPDDFKVSPASLSSIATGGTGAFTVTPANNLASGTYTATVTVGPAGGNTTGIAPQAFTVRFTKSLATLRHGGSFTGYGTVQAALAAAGNGDTVMLNGDTTETINYTATGKTVVLDGNNHKITGVSGTNGINNAALNITGSGTLILKDINLIGSASAIQGGDGINTYAGFSGTIAALGTVTANGGAGGTSGGRGVYHSGSGTVNVNTAVGGTTNTGGTAGEGIRNEGTGTINVGTATGGRISGGNTTAGIKNSKSGTVNADEANGIVNEIIDPVGGDVIGGGLVNVGMIPSDVRNGGIVNAGEIDCSINNYGTGTVNVGTYGGRADPSIHIDSIKKVTLTANGGDGCVLSSITIAANGTTNVGALPVVFDPATFQQYNWYYDANQTQQVTGGIIDSTKLSTALYAGFLGITKVNTPTATPSSGAVAPGTTVTLSCATSGAQIYYTTDGDDPTTTNGCLYSSSITINSAETIKAIAVKNGMVDSAILTQSYTIGKMAQTGFEFTSAQLGKTYGDTPFTVSATGGQSSGAVSYAVTRGSDVLSVDATTGNVIIHKAGTATITATKAGDNNYADAAAELPVSVSKATPTIQTLPVASGISVIGKLSSVNLSGGKASVPGTFSWTNPNAVVSSSGHYDVTFTPTDTSNYNTATCKVDLAVIPLLTSSQSNISFDLSGATLPAGVTSVSLGSTAQGSDSSTYSVVTKVIGQNQTLGSLSGLMIYDLKLLDQNGDPITNFTGKIKVKIPIPAGMSGNLKVLWYNPANGTVTNMNATQENGYLVFETTHFSYYAIAQLAVPTAQPNTAAPISSNKMTSSTASKASATSTSSSTTANASTGDNSTPLLPLALLGAGSAAGLVVMKQRKKYRVKK